MRETEIPEFIIEKVLMSTLMKDKSIGRLEFNQKFAELRDAITEYLMNDDTGFVSNNNAGFKEYLESKVGEVEFVKPFAVRIRPGSVRLFVFGVEIIE